MRKQNTNDVKPDSTALACLFASLGEIPARLAALEDTVQRAASDLAAMRAAQPPTLVTVPEAAARCVVSVPTMRRWVRQGRVPSIKVGNTVRVDVARLRPVDDVEAARLARIARHDG